jgi:hypothetical protein
MNPTSPAPESEQLRPSATATHSRDAQRLPRPRTGAVVVLSCHVLAIASQPHCIAVSMQRKQGGQHYVPEEKHTETNVHQPINMVQLLFNLLRIFKLL